MLHEFTGAGHRIILKPFTQEDIEPLRLLRNKPHNRRWFVYADEISADAQKQWFEQYKAAADDVMFSVTRSAQPDQFIGAVALYHIDQNNGSAEFGRILIDSENVKEKGLGLDATLCVLKIGFGQMGLERVYLEVFSDNMRAIRLYEKAGFTKTGEDISKNMTWMKIEKGEFFG